LSEVPLYRGTSASLTRKRFLLGPKMVPRVWGGAFL